jgi:hypothetical protein
MSPGAVRLSIRTRLERTQGGSTSMSRLAIHKRELVLANDHYCPQRDAINPRKNCDCRSSRRIIVRLSVKSETGGYLTGSAHLSRARCGKTFRSILQNFDAATQRLDHSSWAFISILSFRHRYSFWNLDISQVRNEIVLEALHCSISPCRTADPHPQ